MQSEDFDPTDDKGIEAINNAKAVLEVILLGHGRISSVGELLRVY